MIYQFNQIMLDTKNFKLYSENELIHCEPLVFDLIIYLIENSSNLVSRDELLDNLWKGREVSDATLSNHIKMARKALGDDGQQQRMIETVRGRGYRFIASPLEIIKEPKPESVSSQSNQHAHKNSNNTPQESATSKAFLPTKTDSNFVGQFRYALIAILLLVVSVSTWSLLNSKSENTYKQTTRIAVLPFSNTLHDPQTDFLGFAIADQIIGDLIYFEQISVQPSSSVRQYIGKIVDINEFSETRKLDYVLSGSYVAKDSRIRFLVELIQSRTGQLIWRESFDIESQDIFIFQESISKLVSKKLEIQLSPDTIRRLEKNIPKSPIAYELYLKSKSQPYINQGHEKAIEFLEQALKLDPNYAPIYAELGHRHSHLAVYSLGSFEDSQISVNYLLKSLEMNDELLEAYAALGMLYTDMGEPEKAVSAIKKAIAINPNYAQAHFSLGYVYRYAGMIDESIKSMEIALTIEPKNPRFRSIGASYLYKGDYINAKRGFDLDKESVYSLSWNTLLYIRAGDLDKAREYITEVQKLQEPNSLFKKTSIVYKSIIDKDYQKGLQVMKELSSINTVDGEIWYHWSSYYAALGDHKNSLGSLEKAIDYGFFNYPTMSKDPFYENLQGNDDFKKLMQKARAKHLSFKDKHF